MCEHTTVPDRASCSVGAVAIGRNEGERLRRCLRSATRQRSTVVYVDSGSTDDSVAFARSLGLDVVELDLSAPFTAARARNAGLERLCQIDSDIEFVQFVDGDCELVDGWIDSALDFLLRHEDVAAVCGRRRERYPDASLYNRLCDIEWDTSVGDARAFGGDVMIRRKAFQQVGGYDGSIIAAEDDELSVRLRLNGRRIHRLDHEMTLHDANIHHFGQWWKRSARAGHAFAQVSSMHGRTRFRYMVREAYSTWVWAAGIPGAVLAAAPLTSGWSLVALAVYPLQVLRLIYRFRRQGRPVSHAWAYALHCVAAKFPQFIGVLRFHVTRMRGRQAEIIEYKPPPASAESGHVDG